MGIGITPVSTLNIDSLAMTVGIEFGAAPAAEIGMGSRTAP